MFNRIALKEQRVKMKLSQGELADKLNRTQAAVSQWESGKKIPSKVDIRSIARVLGISLDALDIPEDKVIEIINDFDKEVVSSLRKYKKHLDDYIDDHFGDVLDDVDISQDDVDTLFRNLSNVIDAAGKEFEEDHYD